MRRRSLSVALLLMTGTLLAGLVVVPVSVRASTLYVGGAGPGNYTTIQEAIDAASPRDIVYVHNGTYNENIYIGKSVTLIGQDRHGTIIDGGGAGDVVRAEGEEVWMESFTIRNSGHGDAGISFDKYGGHAEKLIIVSNYIGVRVAAGAGGSVAHSEFSGITSDSVVGNDAIYVGVGGSSFVDGWVGIGGWSTGGVGGNLFLGGGICFGGMDGWAPYYCGVSGNHMVNAGISLSYTRDCFVSSNTLVSGGIWLHLAGGTTLDHNNFVDSAASDFNNDGHVNYTNWWDYMGEGNYWSDYTGVDADGDGIGDTPYVIDEDTQDNYPLMNFSVKAPSPPRDLKGWAGNQRATLVWREPLLDGGSPVTNYSIYRRVWPQPLSLIAEIGNVTTYTDLSVTPGQTYSYEVRATNSIGEGGRSDSVVLKVPADGLTPEDRARNPWVGDISLNSTPPLPPIPGREDKAPSSDDDDTHEVLDSPLPREAGTGFKHERELRCAV